MMQLAIMLITMITIVLIVHERAHVRGLGYAIALCGQPLWIIETWSAQQWGMLVVSLWFSGCYALGLYRVRTPLRQWLSGRRAW